MVLSTFYMFSKQNKFTDQTTLKSIVFWYFSLLRGRLLFGGIIRLEQTRQVNTKTGSGQVRIQNFDVSFVGLK